MKTVLVTNATQYAGPGAVKVLCAQGTRVVCHDKCFADETSLLEHEAAYPQAICLRKFDAAGLVAELTEKVGPVDAVVSNDVYPITKALIEDVSLEDLRRTFDAVLAFPYQLTQLLLPDMKSRGNGCFLFVTSARQLRPEPGFSVPTSIRAGATAFAQALSKEVAAFGIQVNVVAPNYLSSEMYYPRARFVDDEEGRRIIANAVPAGRLGAPEEVGELIAFLVSGRSKFVTGQVIYFTGGWPWVMRIPIQRQRVIYIHIDWKDRDEAHFGLAPDLGIMIDTNRLRQTFPTIHLWHDKRQVGLSLSERADYTKVSA